MTFVTETGSTYQLRDDGEAMRWYRLPTKRSGALRTEQGTLNTWPEVVLGKSVTLRCPPLMESMDLRLITTSRVIAHMSEIR